MINYGFEYAVRVGLHQVFDLKDASIKIQGGGGGEELEIIMDEGNLSLNIQQNYDYKLNRGKLDTVKKGDEVPMTASFSGRFSYFTGDDEVTPLEALENEKFNGSEWESLGWTSADAREGHECDPYCTNIIVDYDPSASCNALAGNPKELTTLRYFRATSIQVDLKAGTLSIDGTCNVRKPEGVRSA